MTSVTIITAVRNGAETIRECLASVRAQSVRCEHLIVDGASTDETATIARQELGAAAVVSEPDGGIYDAMNKGIARASGEIVGLLNADDLYATTGVIEKVVLAMDEAKADACYGDLDYVDRKDTGRVVRRWKSGSHSSRSFYWGWMPPHPTFFVRRTLYQKLGGFDTRLGSAADYELMLRFLLRHNVSCTYVPEVLVKMRTGGVSNASLFNRLKANRQDREAWRLNGLTPFPFTIALKPVRKLVQFIR